VIFIGVIIPIDHVTQHVLPFTIYSDKGLRQISVTSYLAFIFSMMFPVSFGVAFCQAFVMTNLSSLCLFAHAFLRSRVAALSSSNIRRKRSKFSSLNMSIGQTPLFPNRITSFWRKSQYRQPCVFKLSGGVHHLLPFTIGNIFAL
jgi:hypothetical protein